MRDRIAVPVIVFAQLFGTSLWFTANGVGDSLQQSWGLGIDGLGALTGAVQLGFIVGTLLFALSGTADVFRASRLFLVSTIVGAAANLGFAWMARDLASATVFRFVTGMALAGIYPVGMKLIVGWAPERRGEALAWLVGMLTLGTALPHLMRGIGIGVSWSWVVSTASLLAVVGGTMVAWLGDGTLAGMARRLDWGGVFRAFHRREFRAAAFGYFGHMWELYTFWLLVPLLLAPLVPDASRGLVAWWSFAIIGIGALGAFLAGRGSRVWGSAPMAGIALALSGGCCLIYPLAAAGVGSGPSVVLLALLLLWGLTVVADSAQFSALASAAAPVDSVASALAIMNSLGFFISVLSIELISGFWAGWGPWVTWLLVPGPLLGLFALTPLLRKTGTAKV